MVNAFTECGQTVRAMKSLVKIIMISGGLVEYVLWFIISLNIHFHEKKKGVGILFTCIKEMYPSEFT